MGLSLAWLGRRGLGLSVRQELVKQLVQLSFEVQDEDTLIDDITDCTVQSNWWRGVSCTDGASFSTERLKSRKTKLTLIYNPRWECVRSVGELASCAAPPGLASGRDIESVARPFLDARRCEERSWSSAWRSRTNTLATRPPGAAPLTRCASQPHHKALRATHSVLFAAVDAQSQPGRAILSRRTLNLKPDRATLSVLFAGFLQTRKSRAAHAVARTHAGLLYRASEKYYIQDAHIQPQASSPGVLG